MSVLQTQAAVDHGFSRQQHSLWDLPDTQKISPVALLTPTDSPEDNCYFGQDVEESTIPKPHLSHSPTSRWRPKFHIMGPHGWMNDPCAPGYDAAAGLYHVNFQWNPHGHVWGNMSWGSATSPNLIDWTICKTPSMEPTAEQDQCGVFTGALYPQPKTPNDDSQPVDSTLTTFYTSAQKFPISHRLPYTRGSEKLALATSQNSGKTWERDPQNIILEGPPDMHDIISWRDPFIGRWESMDRLRASSGSQIPHYGVISGGLRDQTPAVFLYQIEPGATPKWTFLSSLVDLGLNFCPSRWSGGDFGRNFEVSNFLTLMDSKGKPRDVLITSVEGRKEDPDGGELSKDHRQMWMSGPLKQRHDGPCMEFQFGGALDHGSFYAANGFWDPLTDHFVAFGWIFEEDLPANLVERQGWSGCLSIPRIVSLKSWKSIVGTLKSLPSEMTCFSSSQEADGTYTLETVTLTPDPRLQQCRFRDLSPQQPFGDGLFAFATAQSQLEIDLSFHINKPDRRIGFDILHSSDSSEYTRIYFDASSETLFIDRSKSTRLPGINVSPKKAPHTLFEMKKGETTVREDLEFHVFFDTSVLEVFVNGRVAITTRVYPEEGTCYGIRIYAGDNKEAAISKGSFDKKCETQASIAEPRRLNIWILAARVSSVD